MARKQKRNLQKLIIKKQSLAELSQKPMISFKEAVPVEPKEEGARLAPAQPGESALVQAKPAHHNSALKKTAISIVLIALILTAAIIFDLKTIYLNHFGDWLYQTLRLQS